MNMTGLYARIYILSVNMVTVWYCATCWRKSWLCVKFVSDFPSLFIPFFVRSAGAASSSSNKITKNVGRGRDNIIFG